MPIPFDNSFAALGSPFSTKQPPDPVKDPSLIRVNDRLATELGIDPQWLGSQEGIEVLAGNRVADGSEPVAAAYAGHQFGHFNPQLGDGRAVLLGEVVDQHQHRYDLQLKGSGRTDWSRGGDGRSPLGPVLREYIVSEAMAALGVPTTRALAAVATGEPVMRDGIEPGAVLTRVASSHLRVGTMQYFAAREDRQSLATLVSYVLERHYLDKTGAEKPAVALLEAVIAAQAALIARWQLLGFVHGVMNTDNMLLCGETVDYGPCAFMEEFHPETLFSSIDQQGRYAYCNQPGIAQWNLARLAEAVLPLINDDADAAVGEAKTALSQFTPLFEEAYQKGLAKKLGLGELTGTDITLADDLFAALQEDQADFTLAFRFLADEINPGGANTGAGALFKPGQKLLEWLPLWAQRQQAEPGKAEEKQSRMFSANPAFIPRNHLIQHAIEEGETGNYELFHRLVNRLANPSQYSAADSDLALPAKPQERVTRTFCGT
ncbi:protein adenylyltransferase SelO [Congregibacter sp.]|uniref:protein adenylyltransferase SelO n=1 Tax=Congregibacter sp. TaxID=2744308 RepID=UPI003F6B3D8A